MGRFTAVVAAATAIVVSASTLGDSPQRSLVFDGYSRSEAFDANVAWHEHLAEHEIRMSYFHDGNPRIAMRCAADLSSYDVTTLREVYDHATQAQKTRKLSHAQVLTIRNLLRRLSPEDKEPKLENLLIVSCVDGGERIIHLFDRMKAPRDVIRLYDLTGAYLPAAVGEPAGERAPAELIAAAMAGENYPTLPRLSTEIQGLAANEIKASQDVRRAYELLAAENQKGAASTEAVALLEKQNALRCLLSCLCVPHEDVQLDALRSVEGGLQMHATAPRVIEQGMPLQVKIGFRYERNRLDPGIERLNAFLRDEFLELLLTDLQTDKTWTVIPYDPTAGMPPPFGTGRAAVPLDGSNIEPWQVRFPLVKLYDELKPGTYLARVRFTFPKEPTRYWRGTEAEWDEAGFWHGKLASSPFRLRVLAETPETRAVLIPSKLRLRKELVRLREDDVEETGVPAIYFDKRDAEQVEVPVRNGHFIGTWIYQNGEPSTLQGGLLKPDGPNAIGVWYDYQGGDKKVSYTIEVFETAKAPQHGWMPGRGSAGYRVLWKKTFQLSFREDEIQRLIAGRANVQRKALAVERY
ncbi:MAG: beta galactosidase jelly roll domain-containing protein [Planctomycetes bacterium]|nr:beta galactosidase jelly roll domain-containing protein [Planctomycetota bacterium]